MYRMHACSRRILASLAHTERECGGGKSTRVWFSQGTLPTHPPTQDRTSPLFSPEPKQGLTFPAPSERSKKKKKIGPSDVYLHLLAQADKLYVPRAVGQENQYCFTHAQSVLLGAVAIIWACCEDAALETRALFVYGFFRRHLATKIIYPLTLAGAQVRYD